MYLVDGSIESKIYNQEYGLAFKLLIDNLEKRFIAIESDMSALKIHLNAIHSSLNKIQESK